MIQRIYKCFAGVVITKYITNKDMNGIELKSLKPNVNNPRYISDGKMKELVKSLQAFPKMMELRPIVVDNDGVILGGNMRYRALQELGYDVIPNIWVKWADELTEEERREFIIKDNVPFGSWDWDILANQWDQADLEDWGLQVVEPEENTDNIVGEVKFSEYIGEENNYVVLLFDNELDWLVAQTHFKLKSVSSKRANGKPWSKGIGRVINGGQYLKKMKDEGK